MDIMKAAKKVETLIENKRKDLVKPYNDEVKRINDYAKTLTGKMPPAIEKAKDEVLAFQKREEKRLNDLRTKAREDYLISIGYIHFPEGNEWVAGNMYSNSAEQIIDRRSLEGLDDLQWSKLLQQKADELEQKAQAKIDALKTDLEGADFFGDSDAKEAITHQIEEVKKEVEIPARGPAHVPAFGSAKVKGLTKRWTFEITNVTQVPREYLQVDEKKIREA